MYKILLNIHSTLAFVLIALLILLIILSIVGLCNPTKKYPLPNLFTLIVSHIQFLVGLILWFISPIVQELLQNISVSMKDSQSRITLIEHPAVMIFVVSCITLGHIKIKHNNNINSLYRQSLLYFGMALLLLLSRIPWNSWL